MTSSPIRSPLNPNVYSSPVGTRLDSSRDSPSPQHSAAPPRQRGKQNPHLICFHILIFNWYDLYLLASPRRPTSSPIRPPLNPNLNSAPVERTTSPIHNDGGEETDNEIWSGTSRSRQKKASDLECSRILIEVVKKHYKALNTKKVSRKLMWGKVADEVRKRGVKITRNPAKSWEKVSRKWRKLKESYDEWTNPPTGESAKPKPPLYDELDEILGGFLFKRLFEVI